MSLRLILMRHAKSDWSEPDLDDFERPLNARGRRGADTVGDWLAEQGIAPERVLCSAARRTEETCARVLARLGAAPPVRLDARLYLASAQSMFNILCEEGGPARCLMMIGHNPGTASLAAALCATPPPEPEFRRFPTAATAIMEFDARGWARIGAGGGRLVRFATPRLIGRGAFGQGEMRSGAGPAGAA